MLNNIKHSSHPPHPPRRPPPKKTANRTQKRSWLFLSITTHETVSLPGRQVLDIKHPQRKRDR